MEKILGYLPQKSGMYKELTVFESMEYMAAVKRLPPIVTESEIKRCLTAVNLFDKADDRVSTLSGGMIRRLGIGYTLLGDPKILIVDEPTVGLDPEERMRFKNIIHQLSRDKVVILSTHIIEDVEAICQYILIMQQGQIVKRGTVEEIAQCASGKVFLINGDDFPEQEEEVISILEKEGRAYLRILSPLQKEGRVAVPPTVEDGYLAVIKGISL